MKKSVLWYVAICAGAVTFVVVAILVVMYSRDIIVCVRGQLDKIKSLKDKAMLPFTIIDDD
jgi:hypothetical protein